MAEQGTAGTVVRHRRSPVGAAKRSTWASGRSRVARPRAGGAHRSPRSFSRSRQAWSLYLLKIPALCQLARRSAVASAAATGIVQVVLSYFLWRAVYANTDTAAGLDVNQAISYVTMAILIRRIRWGSHVYSRESMSALVRDGRIGYWFLRPVSARRYHLLKSVGEVLYWGSWSMVGFALGLATGVIMTPPSPAAGVVSAVSLVLGQALTYQLLLIIDLLCFWTTANRNATLVYSFSHDLLSGAFVPLWYFPGWFQSVVHWLPFEGTLNIPVSLYVGRVPVVDAPKQLAIQLAWCCVLGVVTHTLWQRAGRRVAVQGG